MPRDLDPLTPHSPVSLTQGEQSTLRGWLSHNAVAHFSQLSLMNTCLPPSVRHHKTVARFIDRGLQDDRAIFAAARAHARPSAAGETAQTLPSRAPSRAGRSYDEAIPAFIPELLSIIRKARNYPHLTHRIVREEYVAHTQAQLDLALRHAMPFTTAQFTSTSKNPNIFAILAQDDEDDDALDDEEELPPTYENHLRMHFVSHTNGDLTTLDPVQNRFNNEEEVLIPPQTHFIVDHVRVAPDGRTKDYYLYQVGIPADQARSAFRGDANPDTY